MRKITYLNIDKQFLLDKNIFYNIVIYNSHEYYNFVTELYNQVVLGEDGKFVYSLDNQIKQLKGNCKLLINLFDLDLNDRKLINALYKETKSQILLTDYITKYNNLITAYNRFMYFVRENLTIDIDYDDEIELLSVLKFANIKPELSDGSFIEKLLSYIKIYVELTKIDTFWTLNLKSFLSNDEINDFINEMNLLKVNILNIETKKDDYHVNNQINIVIDRDLCEYYSK